MKKVIQQSVTICDVEGCENHAHTKCLGCGRDYCYDHKKTLGREYSAGVYFSGSGDGFYCTQCDARLSAKGDKLLLAYKKVSYIRDDIKVSNEMYDKRIKEAEAALEKLLTA